MLELRHDSPCSLSIKKAPHHRIDLFPVVRSLFASIGLSFNLNFQSGFKLHSEMIIPDDDSFKPAFRQSLVDAISGILLSTSDHLCDVLLELGLVGGLIAKERVNCLNHYIF